MLKLKIDGHEIDIATSTKVPLIEFLVIPPKTTKTPLVVDNHDLHVELQKQLEMCSCGGTIFIHKSTCPENKVTTSGNELEQGTWPALDVFDVEYISNINEIKCVCGSDSIGGGTHSKWCDKYKEF